MKQEWNLKNAFPEMPEMCHDALMRAARSVKEEKKAMKHPSLRTALIAALIIVSTMTAALAAGRLLGWREFYPYDIPDSAKEILDATQVREYQVGPVTFTVNELLTDGHIAMAAATARVTDGSGAVLSSEVYDAIGANGENGRALAAKWGLPPETGWIDAAKLRNVPFYRVSMHVEVPQEMDGGEAMGDTLWDEEGNCALYYMPMLIRNKVGDSLPVRLGFTVTAYDMTKVEPPSVDYTREDWENSCREAAELDRWQAQFDVTLTVPAPLAEKTYTPAAPYEFPNGLTLNRVTAEQTVAGAYVIGEFTLRDGVDFRDANNGELMFQDADGREIPWGMAESGIIEYDDLPTVRWGAMLNLTALPDTLAVRLGDTAVTVWAADAK